MKIFIYLLPYDSGVRGERMGAGPPALLQHGLLDALRGQGHTVVPRTIEADTAFATEIVTSFALYRQLAAWIGRDCADGGFPLVLSGNCGAALGALSGLTGVLGSPPGAAWFDAHGDFHTPDTTQSGFLDGMALAAAAGLAWKALTQTIPAYRPVPAGHIVHIGGRAFDPAEARLLAEHQVRQVRASQVHETGVRASLEPAIRAFPGAVTSLYLHLDTDVLDPVETPANHFPAPGGLVSSQAAEAITCLRERFTMRGMGVASYDPSVDAAGKTAAALLGLIAVVLGDVPGI